MLGLAGCGVTSQRPPPPIDLAAVPDATPRPEPLSRYGNPPWYEVEGRRYHTLASGRGFVERGVASWYGPDFHGKPTSTLEPYDMYAMTAAHPRLPLPAYVSVTNLENGRRVVVRVNDRGPFRRDRVIDLSYTAAYKLGILERGTGLVEVRAIDPEGPADLDAGLAQVRRPDLYVQVGAFGSRDNAHRLRSRVAELVATPVRLSPTGPGEATLYRVRVGPLSDLEEADRTVARLADAGVTDHRVVVE
jgi:rare lipoprotein A